MKKWVVNSSIFVTCIVAGVWFLADQSLPSWLALYRLKASAPITCTLKDGPFTIEAPAFGELQAASSTAISVPQVRTGGLKVFWIVKDGSMVRKGDTLVEFDATELIQQAEDTNNSLEATLRQLEMTVLRGNSDTGQTVVDREIAGLELDKARTQAPKDREIFTRNEIIEGELNIDLSNTKVQELSGKVTAKNNLNDTSQRILVIERKQHESKRDMLRQSLGSLKILAPHDGLVLHKKEGWWMQGTSVGDTRWPGTVILTIPDISSMKARVYVLEADAGNLKVGQKGTIVVDSNPGTRFDVTVERLETLARPLDKESPVKYFEVLLKIDAKANEVLRPGKMVHARITVARLDHALVVPRSALSEENRKFFVWVDRPQGPEKREVKIGSGDAARIALLSGVSDGESVLLNPPESEISSKGKDSGNSPALSKGRGAGE
jgi:multidrug efflux pump subunit AcrA (membrane-fusion protein)